MERMREALAWSLSTPRRNLQAGLLLAAVSVLGFAAFVAVEDGLASSSAVGLLWGSMVFVLLPLLVLASLGFLALPARWGARRAGAGALAVYLGVGMLASFAGIPGYIDPGAWYLLPSWPSYVLWLHECALGVGLWPCPPG